jgi:hypothetical protein
VVGACKESRKQSDSTPNRSDDRRLCACSTLDACGLYCLGCEGSAVQICPSRPIPHLLPVCPSPGSSRMLLGSKHSGTGPVLLHPWSNSYFGITSRANLLATTSRRSLRFFPASIMASRDP